jgi:hypothetical protein
MFQYEPNLLDVFPINAKAFIASLTLSTLCSFKFIAGNELGLEDEEAA